MPTDPSPSLLLVKPPPQVAFQHPPGTLAGMMAFVSAIGSSPCPGPPIPEYGTGQAELLQKLMKQATVDHQPIYCVCRDAFQPAALQNLMDTLQAQPTGLRLSLACSIGNTPDAALPVPAGTDAIVQLQWRATDRLPDLGVFKAVSRTGTWNHLILDGPAATAANRGAIARQPNIIHSWEAITGGHRQEIADNGYGGLPALPGRPLWQVVEDPVHRFMLIERFGKTWLLRSRLVDDGQRIVSLGEALTYHYALPDQLPDGYLDEICAMVAAGGTVATTHVRSNLENAYLIGYVLENGVIVGNSSLKHPRPQYIAAVRGQSGLDLTGFVERGYTSVRPEYRGLGIGTRLLEGLTARAGKRKIFSVIAEDNEATKIIARRNRTRQVARYYSEKAGKPVGIWMPEWMIDDHEKKRS
jgi:GNAT superfamily N-acetyltransferase